MIPHRLSEDTGQHQPEDPARRSQSDGIPVVQSLRIEGSERGPEGMFRREKLHHQQISHRFFGTFPQAREKN